MLHVVDSAGPLGLPSRAQWMALLARAPVELMEPALGSHAQATPHWLRAPQTGLMMVQGRVGGTGERFNVGEVTVTRCALRLQGAGQDATVGVAYVLGRSHRQAVLAAVADAMLQDPAQQSLLCTRLLNPLREHLADLRTQRHARAQSTRVEFFTVAREAGATQGAEDDA
jgi:alpha-D-ribose 1-methylphosphonate 5-triphosphate synthase subunit PhnG